ncbi:alpha-ketoacid dehydrogenase kinase N-terminal domain-containing protein [Hymenopellis radicata]|nr:alpha-ketoacid dehydrogenase kinase N-terminal domain-containing protein [Hymenopellis radicata]
MSWYLHRSRFTTPPRINRAPCCTRRWESTALHFYQNRQLELYASKEAKRLTLRQLVFFGRSMTEARLITSANYVRTELPVRIAHRLRDLQALPYIVVTQEGVAKVYELYWSAFEKFRRYPVVNTLEENTRFCEFLRQLLDEHAAVIPNLYLGLSLSSPYLLPDQLDSFMRRMLTSRISRRVLAEHHLALSEGYSNGKDSDAREPHVGIISTALDVEASIRKCIDLLRSRPYYGTSPHQWPQIIADGHLGTKFPYIREHLEYIVFEILKNSMDATCRYHASSPTLPEIAITIAEGVNDVGIRISDQGGGLSLEDLQVNSSGDLFSFSHVRNATRLENSRLGALRTAVGKREGLRATVSEQVARWKLDSDEKDSVQAVDQRIGVGLPMSHIFSTYFGGSLELVSLDGWGTDAYLRLPKLGTNLEGIEV